MSIRLEDDFEDILAKAIAGQFFDLARVAQESGLSKYCVQSLLDGHLDIEAIQKLAVVLCLDADKLVTMAQGACRPPELNVSGLQTFNSPFPVPGYEEMTVNNYLVWDKATKEAVIFDTGACVKQLFEYVQEERLKVCALILTHTHRDHVAMYTPITEQFLGLNVYSPEGEPYGKSLTVRHGDLLRAGSLTIEARLTNGHSPSAMSYVIGGLSKPVAIVGDSIFSLSMGKAPQAYQLALKNNREQLLSLPNHTILCPGHGPLTTVQYELDNNPFF